MVSYVCPLLPWGRPMEARLLICPKLLPHPPKWGKCLCPRTHQQTVGRSRVPTGTLWLIAGSAAPPEQQSCDPCEARLGGVAHSVQHTGTTGSTPVQHQPTITGQGQLFAQVAVIAPVELRACSVVVQPPSRLFSASLSCCCALESVVFLAAQNWKSSFP